MVGHSVLVENTFEKSAFERDSIASLAWGLALICGVFIIEGRGFLVIQKTPFCVTVKVIHLGAGAMDALPFPVPTWRLTTVTPVPGHTCRQSIHSHKIK